MNQFHQNLLAEIKEHSGLSSKFNSQKYVGTQSFQYHVTNPDKWNIAKKWVRENKDISLEQLLDLLVSLNSGQSHDEKSLAGMILFLLPKLRTQINPEALRGLLENRHGWAEVDNLCQNNFQYQDFFTNWPVWEKALREFSKDKNVHIRRASLVLLTGPVSYCPDGRLSDLAFDNIDRLKIEKDILITKAVSWLLRSLIKYHKIEVADYLKKNADCLPKIAVRETLNKLKSGRKSGH